MRTVAWLFFAAYCYMLGTAFGTGTPYTKCPRLQDTNFTAFLESYSVKRPSN